MTIASLPCWRGATRLVSATLVAVAGLSLIAGCGGSESSSAGARRVQTTSVAPSSTVATTATSLPATTTTSTARASAKVSANTASIAELTAAFTAAGISSPDRWAREVDEYRPYPTNDPSFAKLRQELAKYNPAPGVVDQIVATLSL